MTKKIIKTPILIIKDEYFKEILEGKKVEEYRSLSEHYFKMFCEKGKDGYYDKMKPIKEIILAVGYNKNRKTALVEVKDIYICEFQNEIPEGFEKGDECFVIELGNVKKTDNV